LAAAAFRLLWLLAIVRILEDGNLLDDQLLARYSAWANKAEAFARIAGTEKLLAETDPERNERMVGDEE
jgi:hypothetical protein